MSDEYGNDSAELPQELTDIAWKVDALIREHSARDRFREMITEAENQLRRRCEDEKERKRRRLEHFEKTVPANPRLRDLEAGPPEPDWVWNWEREGYHHLKGERHPPDVCSLPQIEAWMPPELHRDGEIDTTPPVPLPEREMSLAENYLVLGALRDYVCKSEEKLFCWEDLEGENYAARIKSKKGGYLISVGEVSKLRPEQRKPLEAFLQKVEEDLQATVCCRDTGPGWLKHSPDFRSVNWGERLFSFTPNQAMVVRVLHAALLEGAPEVGNHTLLTKANCDSSRLESVFRKSEAWGTMIAPGTTKGTRRIVPPPSEETSPAPKPTQM